MFYFLMLSMLVVIILRLENPYCNYGTCIITRCNLMATPTIVKIEGPIFEIRMGSVIAKAKDVVIDNWTIAWLKLGWID